MMLNISASYNYILNIIINTLYKISTTSRINIAQTHHFELKVFQINENFENFVGGITILSQSAEYFER